jgi:hypothetical protein
MADFLRNKSVSEYFLYCISFVVYHSILVYKFDCVGIRTKNHKHGHICTVFDQNMIVYAVRNGRSVYILNVQL